MPYVVNGGPCSCCDCACGKGSVFTFNSSCMIGGSCAATWDAETNSWHGSCPALGPSFPSSADDATLDLEVACDGTYELTYAWRDCSGGGGTVAPKILCEDDQFCRKTIVWDIPIAPDCCAGGGGGTLEVVLKINGGVTPCL